VEKRGVGVPLNRELKRFGFFLIDLKSSNVSRWFFEEEQVMRTQEFVFRWSSNPAGPFREIVRQQWNFSAPASTREAEDYRVELVDVAVLELTILPDISGGTARASLRNLRLT
jgi:hypothetical protein